MTTIQFASTDEEAKKKFEQYSSNDPFPEIPPALLNSADVFDYVRATGMVFPFNQTPERLKSASYEVPLLGLVILLGRGQEVRKKIERGTKFQLKKTQLLSFGQKLFSDCLTISRCVLTFGSPTCIVGYYRAPGHLLIRGLQGGFWIPLHNLTSEDYELAGGDGLIWVEFTKLSPNSRWMRNRIAPAKFP